MLYYSDVVYNSLKGNKMKKFLFITLALILSINISNYCDAASSRPSSSSSSGYSSNRSSFDSSASSAKQHQDSMSSYNSSRSTGSASNGHPSWYTPSNNYQSRQPIIIHHYDDYTPSPRVYVQPIYRTRPYYHYYTPYYWFNQDPYYQPNSQGPNTVIVHDDGTGNSIGAALVDIVVLVFFLFIIVIMVWAVFIRDVDGNNYQ